MSKKILVFELNWLGDILFSVPLLKALKYSEPDVFIACAVVPRYADILRNTPWVDKIMPLSDDRGPFSIFEKLKFMNLAKKEKFDSCVLLKPSRSKAEMASKIGIKKRIGFGGKVAPLTLEITPPPGSLHRVDQLLALAEGMKIPLMGRKYEFPVSADDLERAKKFLTDAGIDIKKPVVAFNPGGNWGPKRWPDENFADLAVMVLKEYKNVSLILTGANKDEAVASGIAAKVNSNRCVSMAGKTGLKVLGAIFKLCGLVVSADSGPMHLASAVGTKTLCLFGPTSPAITGPCGKGESVIIHHDISCEVPCYLDECRKGYICMQNITVSEVFESFQKAYDGQTYK
ncbi:MAG: lipopolysaccharide heptosyltransferase II [Candidatus Omnitrophica bacterium]|nr:lipopolysaccharide heptosyltransferase II [Candidatus Omnitrophota bacterium]